MLRKFDIVVFPNGMCHCTFTLLMVSVLLISVQAVQYEIPGIPSQFRETCHQDLCDQRTQFCETGLSVCKSCEEECSPEALRAFDIDRDIQEAKCVRDCGVYLEQRALDRALSTDELWRKLEGNVKNEQRPLEETLRISTEQWQELESKVNHLIEALDKATSPEELWRKLEEKVQAAVKPLSIKWIVALAISIFSLGLTVGVAIIIGVMWWRNKNAKKKPTVMQATPDSEQSGSLLPGGGNFEMQSLIDRHNSDHTIVTVGNDSGVNTTPVLAQRQNEEAGQVDQDSDHDVEVEEEEDGASGGRPH